MEDIDLRFKETIFLVECNTFEYITLWNEWKDKVIWEHDSLGKHYQTGKLNDHQIWTSMTWAKINNKLVLFYENTSRVVDINQVKNWFKQNCYPTWDNDTRIAHCDAMNFHLCINAIKEQGK